MSNAIDINQPAGSSTMSRVSAYVDLTKPRIATLVLIATGMSFAIALPVGTSILDVWASFVAAIVGTGMAAAAANALNQYWEIQFDAQMERTRNRPIPSGRMTARDCLVFGVLTACVGIVLLALAVSPLCAALASISLITYVWIYTPLKRVSAMCVFIGAVPGALPVMIGAAAATGNLTLWSWLLFAIVFFWQLPHFAAIAWIYREDYAKAGYPVMPVVDSPARIDLHIITHTIGLIVASLLPVVYSLSGGMYALCASFLGLGFMWFGIAFIKDKSHKRARQHLLYSIVYLPLLFLVLLVERFVAGV